MQNESTRSIFRDKTLRFFWREGKKSREDTKSRTWKRDDRSTSRCATKTTSLSGQERHYLLLPREICMEKVAFRPNAAHFDGLRVPLFRNPDPFFFFFRSLHDTEFYGSFSAHVLRSKVRRFFRAKFFSFFRWIRITFTRDDFRISDILFRSLKINFLSKLLRINRNDF